MHYWENFSYAPGLFFGSGLLTGLGGVLFAVIIIWSIVWKGMALWRAARAGSKPWFVALLVVNTLGILEILYLYVFSKKGGSVLRQAQDGEQSRNIEESKTE